MATSECITIPLTRGYSAIVDKDDKDLLSIKWQAEHNYAIHAWRKNKVYGRDYMHRIILSRMLKRELLEGELVDHVNCNSLDNRRSNLRLANPSSNNWNARRRSDNKSGYKGVSKDGTQWRARIMINKKAVFLGNFTTADEAYEAYCQAAKELHGEFARFE